jgi:myo-inositol-1(or 4)-monophosphatase
MSRQDDLARIRDALEAATEAIRPFTPGDIAHEKKEARGDPLTEADLAANRALHAVLPRDGEGWLSEESVDDAERLGRDRVWIVDPIDGTREFIDGVPEWCVSIGLVERGEPVAGGIYNPVTDELVIGSVETGVSYNGVPARVSNPEPDEPLTVLASRSEIRRGEWDRFEEEGVTVEPCGSVAYKMALVAAGRADATWTLVPKSEWDVAGGTALVRAAGGVVTLADGTHPRFNRADPRFPNFVAAGSAMARVGRMIRGAAVTLLLVAMAGALAPLHAQRAGTLPPLDPAYRDLELLEAHGLLPRGMAAQRPLSYGRVAWLVQDARAWLASRLPASAVERADLEATLSRLERRFDGSRLDRAEATFELEAGGGKSPGHDLPENGLGGLDAVINPLWHDRGGRAYGDERTAALAGRLTVPLGTRVAIGVGGRAVTERSSGLGPRRPDGDLEAAYLRVRLGRMALQVGRDAWWQETGRTPSLLMSANGPSMNLIRLSTDRPLRLWFVGDTELSFTAADLGSGQNFPGANLFGVRMSSAPVETVRIGLMVLNKQGGRGAPAASVADRLKDLSFIWDLFRPGQVFEFSDKVAGVDTRILLDRESGLELFAEVVFNDFDHQRIGDVLANNAAYHLGFGAGRLGTLGRHGFVIDGLWTGSLMYRHHQFRSGQTKDGFIQGSDIGPDGRKLTARYSYSAPSQGWSGALATAYEDRSVDPYDVVFDPYRNFFRSGSLPHERRLRVEMRLTRRMTPLSGIEFTGGVERVTNFAFTDGADRTNGALLVRVWRTF